MAKVEQQLTEDIKCSTCAETSVLVVTTDKLEHKPYCKACYMEQRRRTLVRIAKEFSDGQ